MIPFEGELARCNWPDGGCGRKILWSTTEAGKRQALDAKPDPDGSVAAYRALARTRYAPAVWPSRVITKAGAVDIGPQETRFKPHAETCPKIKGKVQEAEQAAAEVMRPEIPGLLPGAKVIPLDAARRRRGAGKSRQL